MPHLLQWLVIVLEDGQLYNLAPALLPRKVLTEALKKFVQKIADPLESKYRLPSNIYERIMEVWEHFELWYNSKHNQNGVFFSNIFFLIARNKKI